MNKTYLPQNSLEREWYVVDATDQRLGRLASERLPCSEREKQTDIPRTWIRVAL